MYCIKRSFGTCAALVLVSILYGNVNYGQEKNYEKTEMKLKNKPGSNTSIFEGTLVNLSWPEVKKAAEENAIVILPIGVIEQHGPHLCLGTDTYLSYQNSLELKQRLESLGVRAVIAPPFYWGIMQLNESGAFPGSFTVSPSTMKALLSDIFADFQRWGFRYFFCYNHHGDRLHRKSLNEAITEAKEKLGIVFYNDQEQIDRDKGPDYKPFVSGKLFEPDYHSGAGETSIMLKYYPGLVNINIAKTLKPENTWQPLGYVGDPANYKSFNMPGYNSAEVKYTANCIADWLKTRNEKAK